MDRVVGLIGVLGMLSPVSVLKVFIHSTSGQVVPERAAAAGWLAAACAAVAAIVAAASPSHAATVCYSWVSGCNSTAECVADQHKCAFGGPNCGSVICVPSYGRCDCFA